MCVCVCFVVQDHIEELSSLSRVHLHDDDEREGVAARLRRQLRAKDEELRQVQRSIAQWKEKTAARLARKFEQELTSELERFGHFIHTLTDIFPDLILNQKNHQKSAPNVHFVRVYTHFQIS